MRYWPVPRGYSKKTPKNGEPGAFKSNAYYAKLDVWHSGVDLFCPCGSAVLAAEECTVAGVGQFTGPPQYRRTYFVSVRNGDGTLAVYGEVRKPRLRVGKRLRAGQVLGRIATVELARGAPKKRRAMLHFELYKKTAKQGIDWWRKGEPRPAALLDPTAYLESCKKRKHF